MFPRRKPLVAGGLTIHEGAERIAKAPLTRNLSSHPVMGLKCGASPDPQVGAAITPPGGCPKEFCNSTNGMVVKCGCAVFLPSEAPAQAMHHCGFVGRALREIRGHMDAESGRGTDRIRLHISMKSGFFLFPWVISFFV